MKKRIFASLLLLALAASSFAADRLRCAHTVFSVPGVKFMQKFRTPDTEAAVSVSGLPKGLSWNARRRLVEGKVKKEGVYFYTAEWKKGEVTERHRIQLTVSSHLQLPTPFMGWLSWNSVQGDVSEAVVRDAVQLLKDRGLYEAGWNYVMMDDLWQARERTADGQPAADGRRFPHGVKAVADYVHQNGMKFGLYTDEADKTCAGAYGSHGKELVDADQYAEWGIDVVKCDYCDAPEARDTAVARYTAMGTAFRKAKKPITLYICEWGQRQPWEWGAEAGGCCWRVSGDVRDRWTCEPGGVGVVESIAAMKDIALYSGVNRFNDADMLCTGLHGTGKSSSDLCFGDAGMTQDEYATQFALWCMWSSPMALSFDPRTGTLTDEDVKMLTNRELIALNQDPMGQQAECISQRDSIVVFAKDLADGSVALSFTNMSAAQKDYCLTFSSVDALKSGKKYTCRDLWTGQEEKLKGTLTTCLRPHATRVYRLRK